MIQSIKGRPLLMGMLGLILTIMMGAVMVSIGVRLYGSVNGFQEALYGNRYWMLLWRISLYSIVAYCWLKVWRPRVLTHVQNDADGGEHAQQVLVRLERLMLQVLVLFEAYNMVTWLTHGGL